MWWIAATLFAAGAGVLAGRKLSDTPSEEGEAPFDPGGRIRSQIEYRASVHEAGHAICAWHNPTVSSINRITIDDGMMGEGRVTYSHSGRTDTPSLWHSVVVSMGGIAAELEEFDRFRSGSARMDLNQAKEAARVIVSRRKINPPWGDAKLPETHFDVGQVFRDPDRGVVLVLNLALVRARQLVLQDKTRLLAVVTILAEKGVMGPAEVQQVFGKRLFWF